MIADGNEMEVTRESFQLLLNASEEYGTKNIDDIIIAELKDDGRFKIRFFEEGDVEGTYTINGENITLTNVDGSTNEGTLKNGELTIYPVGDYRHPIVFSK